MNIFVVHPNPAVAAIMLCDKHVSKMTLETAQMLSTVARSYGYGDPIIYKPVHPKHPCTLWAGKSYWNWKWLCIHGLALGCEFTKRFDNTHKSTEVIRYIYKNKYGPKNKKKYSQLQLTTPFALAMPDEYKCDNPILSYRRYYIGEKVRFAKWKNRNPPNWWKEKDYV